MGRPKTTPKEAVQVKTWIDPEVLEAVDQIAERNERSRAFTINQALRRWVKMLENDRKRKRRGA